MFPCQTWIKILLDCFEYCACQLLLRIQIQTSKNFKTSIVSACRRCSLRLILAKVPRFLLHSGRSLSRPQDGPAPPRRAARTPSVRLHRSRGGRHAGLRKPGVRGAGRPHLPGGRGGAGTAGPRPRPP